MGSRLHQVLQSFTTPFKPARLGHHNLALRIIPLIVMSTSIIPVRFVLLAITILLHFRAVEAWTLMDTYNSANFFNSFTFFTGADPTHGFVNYESKAAATAAGLISTANNQIHMGVDHTTKNPSGGRGSVRVSSNKAYTHGLFIADIAHMPGDICGVWPAFWLFGPNWPNSGEIDIIEGVNLAGTDTVTLHTSAGCVINISGSRGGDSLGNANCNTGGGNSGCSVSNNMPNAYGNAFNNAGGGVFVMQWASSGIYVWFFPRNAIPANIKAGAPITTAWGTPLVAFNGNAGCAIDSHFSNENIVFDTTFCGDWAGAVFSSGSCASKAASCQAYVSGFPADFAQAYWTINYVKVYQ